MHKTIINSGNISTGELHSFVVQLDKSEVFDGTIYIPTLGFVQAAVSVTSTSGSSGAVAIKQSITKKGAGSDFDPALSIAVATGTTEVFDINVSGGYLVIDTTGITYDADGRMVIDVVIKR